jgi:hypothetical protein
VQKKPKDLGDNHDRRENSHPALGIEIAALGLLIANVAVLMDPLAVAQDCAASNPSKAFFNSRRLTHHIFFGLNILDAPAFDRFGSIHA